MQPKIAVRIQNARSSTNQTKTCWIQGSGAETYSGITVYKCYMDDVPSWISSPAVRSPKTWENLQSKGCRGAASTTSSPPLIARVRHNPNRPANYQAHLPINWIASSEIYYFGSPEHSQGSEIQRGENKSQKSDTEVSDLSIDRSMEYDAETHKKIRKGKTLFLSDSISFSLRRTRKWEFFLRTSKRLFNYLFYICFKNVNRC